MIELGGNIKLDGFESLDHATLIVVKKVVGNYARKINDNIGNFQELNINLIANNKETCELKAKLINENNEFNSEVVDKNLFFALDKALAKIMKEAYS